MYSFNFNHSYRVRITQTLMDPSLFISVQFKLVRSKMKVRVTLEKRANWKLKQKHDHQLHYKQQQKQHQQQQQKQHHTINSNKITTIRSSRTEDKFICKTNFIVIVSNQLQLRFKTMKVFQIHVMNSSYCSILIHTK